MKILLVLKNHSEEISFLLTTEKNSPKDLYNIFKNAVMSLFAYELIIYF